MTARKISVASAGLVLVVMLALLAVPACKKYADPPPYFEDNIDTTRPAARKILLIGIDGAVGSEYKTIAPTVLMGLKTHSKYSWAAVSDEVTTDAASWKTLLSGISYSRHNIKDSSFVYSQPSGAGEHDAIASYPSFFSYILSSSRSDLNTSFITQWPDLTNKLAPEVADKVTASSDAGVKDSAILRLKSAKSDLVVVNFSSVAVAGKAGSFSASDAGYKTAVQTVDGYIGELMTALRARPEYNKSEEWLVVITGTHGGTGNSYGGNSDGETGVCTFYFNENFKETEFSRDGSFAGVQMKGRDAAAVKARALNDGGLYDIGNGLQTIQIKIKGSGPGAYPHFFSKTDKFTTPGWTMFTGGANWAFSVRSTTSGERRIQAATGNVFDNQWHTLTVVIYDSAGGRWVKRFTDATRVVDVTTTVNLGSTYGTITSASPLTVGWGADPGYGGVTFYSADIRIFNTALTDDEVVNNLCLKDITQHPKYANLIGYWPGNDAFGGRLRNKAPGHPIDLTLGGPFTWDAVTDLPCTTQAADPDPTVTPLLVKAVDFATTAFYWLKIPVQGAWGLEGSTWITKYEIEFVKL